jgi:hypothetical protein
MAKHSTKTAAVAVGAMLFDDWFDPIEDGRAMARRQRDDHRGVKNFSRGSFGCIAGNLFMMLALIALDTRPSLQTYLSILAMFLMVAYG